MIDCITGWGSADTHAHTLNTGAHPNAGIAYQTVSVQQIYSMMLGPMTVDKDKAQWFIPSSYHEFDGRSHTVQRDRGLFHWLAADIDSGNPELERVLATVRAVLPGAGFMVYNSRSSTAGNKKWRVLVPLAVALQGSQYGAFQAAFFDGMQAAGGLELDRTLERTGQLVYLPNRGEHYQYHTESAPAYDVLQHPQLAARAGDYMQAASAVRSASDPKGGPFIGGFAAKHTIASLLLKYGYTQKGTSNHYRSTYQQSGGYGTQDRGDHWLSLSHSDAAAKLGRATLNGTRYGDAFDLYVHYEHGGNWDNAVAALKAAQYGCADAEHGAALWYNCLSVGPDRDGICHNGPAYGRAALEAAQADLERELSKEFDQRPDPVIEYPSHDWDIAWPPGIVGQVAKHIYTTTTRPVKQYAIASALYLLAGMAGRRYNVEGFGLNLYFMVVGNSGTGKGEARRATERLYSHFGLEAQQAQQVSDVYDHNLAASAAGLRKMFDEGHSVRAIYKEDADAALESLTNAQSGSNGDQLRSELSTFWDKAGAGQTLGATRYSKQDDSTVAVRSPSLTIGLDTQIDPFKRYLGHNVVIDTGIGARFLYVVRHGDRMKARRSEPPPMDPLMVKYLVTLWNGINGNPMAPVINVQWEPGIKDKFMDLDDAVTDAIVRYKGATDIKNRLAMQAAKVAALLAVGYNHIAPTITEQMFEWATKFTTRGYDECIKIVDGGEAGSGERVRVAAAVRVAREYPSMTQHTRVNYRVPKGLLGLSDVLCERYFLERLSKTGDFRGTDNGITSEDIVRRTVQELVRQEYLVSITREDVALTKNIMVDLRVRQPLYTIGPAMYEF